jgi:hypothetical protein
VSSPLFWQRLPKASYPGFQNCPQPHLQQLSTNCQSESYVTTDGQSASVSWCQAPHLGLQTRIFLLSDSCGFVNVGRPLWRENRCVVYNWCWFSPAQSFSGPSPAVLITVIYFLRFKTPQPRRPGPVFSFALLITSRHGPRRKHGFPLLLHEITCLFPKLILRNVWLHSSCLEQICHTL